MTYSFSQQEAKDLEFMSLSPNAKIHKHSSITIPTRGSKRRAIQLTPTCTSLQLITAIQEVMYSDEQGESKHKTLAHLIEQGRVFHDKGVLFLTSCPRFRHLSEQAMYMFEHACCLTDAEIKTGEYSWVPLLYSRVAVTLEKN